MGKKLDETQGDPRIIKILSGMEDKIAKLEDLPETVKVPDNRLSSLVDQSLQEEKRTNTPVSLKTSETTSTKYPK